MTEVCLFLLEVCDNEAVVQQLVQVLCLEGDSINTEVGSGAVLFLKCFFFFCLFVITFNG